MQLGVGHEKIFKAIAPDLLAKFNLTSSLEEAAKFLVDQNGQHIIFYPFKPMLAARFPLAKIEELSRNVSYIAETKMDGERIQCHKQNKTVKFFTRSGNDYSHYYGSLSELIIKNVQAEEVILDGEMVVYSAKTGSLTQFGLNKTTAKSKNSENNLLFYIFDVLLCKGSVSIDGQTSSLGARKAVLEEIVTPVKGQLELLPFATCSSFADVMRLFNESRERSEEGLVLKDIRSFYQCNARNKDWIKVKADYIESIVDSLDLVVLGCYFAKGNRRIVKI